LATGLTGHGIDLIEVSNVLEALRTLPSLAAKQHQIVTVTDSGASALECLTSSPFSGEDRFNQPTLSCSSQSTGESA
jgi:hypothetical protein